MPLTEDAKRELLQRVRTAPTLDGDTPPIAAELRATPEDFRVDEQPAYLPSGEGEHLYLRIEKRGLNTPDAAKRIATALGVDPKGAGWAGLKDRHACTTQWISLHTPGANPEVEPDQAFGEGLWVREVSRHTNKLRAGHLLANRFALRLRGLPLDRDDDVARILSELTRRGLPNYFGEQRFGHGARNLHDALAWLADGGRPPRAPFARKLLMSVWQAAIFNDVLAQRVREGSLDRALAGDLLRKEPAGGQFICEQPEVDTPRVAEWEISPTGPMFGAKMRSAGSPVADRESQALTDWGGDQALLSKVKKFGEGTRRPLRVQLAQVETQREDSDLWLRFDLPSGSYATCVVRELTKTPLWSDTR